MKNSMDNGGERGGDVTRRKKNERVKGRGGRKRKREKDGDNERGKM